MGAAAEQDTITLEIRAALERRGVDSEEWLLEIDVAAKAKEEYRQDQIIRIARWTLAVAVVAAIAGIIAAWPVVQEWLRRPLLASLPRGRSF